MNSFNERKKSNQIKEFRLRWFGQGKQKQPLYDFFKGSKLKELGMDKTKKNLEWIGEEDILELELQRAFLWRGPIGKA